MSHHIYHLQSPAHHRKKTVSAFQRLEFCLTDLSAYNLGRFLLGLPPGVTSLDLASSLNSLSFALSMAASIASEPSLSRDLMVSVLEWVRLPAMPGGEVVVSGGEARVGVWCSMVREMVVDRKCDSMVVSLILTMSAIRRDKSC